MPLRNTERNIVAVGEWRPGTAQRLPTQDVCDSQFICSCRGFRGAESALISGIMRHLQRLADGVTNHQHAFSQGREQLNALFQELGAPSEVIMWKRCHSMQWQLCLELVPS